ncbi:MULTISPECIES: response regulator transcription factor [unclassified Bradyrhizobium]|uniref:response regulator transcription factor n=1 Tax=unclassified Bradyrhizobium TaxID=2631580 RepID=UPI0020B1B67C|nr:MULTISPECIES: response regulator [unclassified Bradyrhizobium]MCP3383458.1 response regulator [Bradyrhizobium sp. CCGUVB4N]MCP3444525.1 response regulator [Bradyrhizobium sp. CCGUVB14]WFU85058.1 response regulator [Bradyrhizobium sp. CIAT3101]
MSLSSIISVIDDDPSVRLATNNLLTSRGYTVYTFGSAHEFLQSGKIDTIACVIADVQMAVMSGVDLLMHLRDLGHLTPFIFMTAFPDDDVRARALKAGAICFLAKPFSTPTLLQCLETALSAPGKAAT